MRFPKITGYRASVTVITLVVVTCVGFAFHEQQSAPDTHYDLSQYTTTPAPPPPRTVPDASRRPSAPDSSAAPTATSPASADNLDGDGGCINNELPPCNTNVYVRARLGAKPACSGIEASRLVLGRGKRPAPELFSTPDGSCTKATVNVTGVQWYAVYLIRKPQYDDGLFHPTQFVTIPLSGRNPLPALMDGSLLAGLNPADFTDAIAHGFDPKADGGPNLLNQPVFNG